MNSDKIPSFYFGEKRLSDLHERMKELVNVKSNMNGTYHFSSKKGLEFVPGYKRISVYKQEYHGFKYRVIYPNEFSFIQTIVAGQVVPMTSDEIVCIH